ncbi:MAG: excinuclease ABC subunit UvrA [Candidatus Pacebacteria bacterium]|nr:excinuclease ABC subunit UvrA [Candidatus Paceibacterota bacterium]
MNDKIKIHGARVHNLKNIDLEIPKNKLVVFTGVSGSGKSSLAFDTIFVEGQRRYIESLSPYARLFLGQADRPDVDDIEGLSPAIAINQKAHGHNPRSIVATLTEIYDYLRVLYARIGKVYCPVCGGPIEKLSSQEIVDEIIEKANKDKSGFITILAPVVRGRKGEYYQMLYDFLEKGFSEARIDGKIYSLHEKVELSRYKNHDIEIIVDKIMPALPAGGPSDASRLNEAVEDALGFAKGLIIAAFTSGLPAGKAGEKLYSANWSCPKDGFSYEEIEPRLFSFNSPHGACDACDGLGKKDFFSDEVCPKCGGKRLKPEALSIRIHGKNISEAIGMTIDEAYDFFVNLESKLNKKELTISKEPLKEIVSRLGFLMEVGLDYITLDRRASSLSGGEAQRIRLASQIGSKLSGTLYVLDEPTIGLHERDNERLIKMLKELKNAGNTVIVVEHDERTIKESDYLVDLGPGPGVHGGEVVVHGETQKLLKSKTAKEESSTVRFLAGEDGIEIGKRRPIIHQKISVIGADANNLKNINVDVPLNKFVVLTGVSGSGKSTLLYDVLYKNIQYNLRRRDKKFEGVNKILGLEYLTKIIEINQSPIGRTPRSNSATYTGMWGYIREIFAQMPEARERGYKAGRFSFNKPGGRCEACEGAGFNLVEMHFLPTISVQCNVCHGKRFNRETLEVKYKGKNIADVLDMTVEEAEKFFSEFYHISDKLKVMKEVGLGYIKLGQPATTLSGGEAQRVKLSAELSRPMTRNAIYLLDEPSTGLHYDDIKMLISVLQKIVDKGNTVVVIEHNMHIIKTADYVIDLGPEGGEKGGKVVAKGTPEEVARNDKSHTGKYLKKYL